MCLAREAYELFSRAHPDTQPGWFDLPSAVRDAWVAMADVLDGQVSEDALRARLRRRKVRA